MRMRRDCVDDYYVLFNEGPVRDWEEARAYGFISHAGQLSRTELGKLPVGSRIWVYVAKRGYVGVGTVNTAVLPLVEFRPLGTGGANERLIDEPVKISQFSIHSLSPSKSEHAIGVTWEKTVSLPEAVYQKGFFTNQNVVCRPKSERWKRTLTRLKTEFGVD